MAILSRIRTALSHKKSTTSSECTKTVKNDNKKDTKKLQSVSYLQLYRHSTMLDKIYMFIGITFTLISALCVTVLCYTIGEATNAMVKYITTTKHETDNITIATAEDTFQDEIINFVVANCILGVFSIAGTFLATVLFTNSALNQTFKIRELFLTKILNQDIAWYDLNQTGDFASRVADDLKKVQEGIGEKVPLVVSYVAIFLTSIFQSLIIGWELALICMASLPISLTAMGLMSWVTSKFTQQEAQVYGAAGAVAEEVLAAIRTVVAFGGEKKEEEKYHKLLKFACDNNVKRSLYNGICNGALWFSTYACYALGFWFGVQMILVNKEKYDVSVMVTVFFSVVTATWFIIGVIPYLETFAIAQGAAVRIFEIIASEPVINASKGYGKTYTKFEGKITFKNVYFSYPSRLSLKVLQGFNLTVNPGETVALVGSSGCGKSTCIQLIQRYYDPEFGNILLDNYNLSGLDLTWIRSHIGVVGQEPVLFDETIAENIRFGCQSATQDEIEEAAKKANAHNFIQAFPQKYETLVGQRGTQLSGGQKQRIAIARALVRKPSILLLDEATSALDTSSEALVQAALDAASTECTTIIVAHRLSTIKRADRIVIMSEGRVQEEGTHEYLMQKKGAYFDLVMAQLTQEDVKEEMPVQACSETLELTKPNNIENEEEKDVSLLPETLQEIENFDVSSIWSIMKYNLPEFWAVILGCICSLINGAAAPVYAILFGKIMGVLVSDDADYIQHQVAIYSDMFVVIAVVLGLAIFFQTYLFGLAGEKLTMRLRSQMFKSYLSQDMSYFDNEANSVGTLCARLSYEAASVQGATGQRIGTILTSISTVIFALSCAFYYEWRVTIVSLCLAPFIVAVCYWEPKLSEQDDEAHYKTLQHSTKIAVEAINGIRTIQSLGGEKKVYDLYMQQIALYQQNSRRNSCLHGIVYGLSRGLIFFTYAIILYYASTLIIAKSVEYQNVLIVSEITISCSWALANALAFAPNFQKGVTAVNRITRILNNVPLVRHGSNDVNQRWKLNNAEYKNVQFSYPSRPKTLILEDFNMKVLQGKMVALVGSSGCGKSTIVQLLERFYDSTFGIISVDDTPIHEMHLSALRSQLGVVSQEPVLFSMTIANNISYGDNTRVVPRTEIIEAAKKANIHNFIVSLPLSYDTKLGEKGTQLSGGQKQRIAIARALIRNPKILLLDEATSALDAENEKIVQEALNNAKIGRTCITIAHRLNTIQDADVICFIKQGRVVEMGSHSELLNLKGLYYKFCNSQG